MEPLKKDEQICYCFGYTVADIGYDVLTNSRSLDYGKNCSREESRKMQLF